MKKAIKIEKVFKTLIVTFDNVNELKEKLSNNVNRFFDLPLSSEYRVRGKYSVTNNKLNNFNEMNLESNSVSFEKYKKKFQDFFDYFKIQDENFYVEFNIKTEFEFEKVELKYSKAEFYFKPVKFNIKGYAYDFHSGLYYVKDPILVFEDIITENVFNVDKKIKEEHLLGNVTLL